jgi:hypothetical protein
LLTLATGYSLGQVISHKLTFAFALITAGQCDEETLGLLNYNDNFPNKH